MKGPSRVVFALCAIAIAIALTIRDLRPIALPPLMRIAPCGANRCLELPVVTYSKGSFGAGPRVDFVGAVHLGDPAYYQGLNKRFESYDAVLFELIGDAARIKELSAARQDSMLGVVQRKMSETLGLSFQLDLINYQAPNFVHADMSPAELSKAMAKRGESVPQLLMRMLKLSFDPRVQRTLQQQGYDPHELDGINPLLLLLRGPTDDERRKLREFMAHGLSTSDQVLKMLEGENGFSLISDRNAAALEVLKREVEKGRKSLAIFYGVGHLPDMHTRLIRDFGFHISKVEWVRAWTL